MSKALLEAAGAGDLVKVKALLASGKVDIEYRHRGTGRTALSEAVLGRHLAVVQHLIASHADANTQDTAMGFSPLAWAADGDAAIVAALLEAGANPNAVAPKSGLTPLLVASANGNRPAVELLLQHGAQVNQAARDGRRPLAVAQAGKHTDVAAILEKAGGLAESTLAPPPVLPWPAVDITLARIDYAVPESVLRSFILAMNLYELEAVQITQRLGHSQATNAAVLAAMQTVFARLCTPSPRPYGRGGSYGMPPEYDPETEHLIGSSQPKPRRAELITRRPREEMLYVLQQKGGEWRMASKKRRLFGGDWIASYL